MPLHSSKRRRARALLTRSGFAILLLLASAYPLIASIAATTSATDAYHEQLRTASGQSWLEQEFQRQRHFPALARSRQFVAKEQYREATAELESYLSSDPSDLVIEFEYLILVTTLNRYHAAIGAADRIIAAVPDFAPAKFYRGLAQAALGENQEALLDLAAVADSGALVAADARYAQRSLSNVALASATPLDALAILDREPAGSAGLLLTVKGQLLERLGRATEAGLAYDEAVESGGNPDDRRAAWLLGAGLALKRSDLAGALSRVQSAWATTPGDPDTAKLLAETASLLGRGDLVLDAEREMQAAGTIDRATHETFGNALFRVGSYDLAAGRFDELAGTATSPDEEYRLRRAAGFASQAGKDAARALFEFQRAVAINPEPKALSDAVEAALQAGRLDVAATDLRRLADSSEGQDGARALMRLSIVEEQNGHFPEALVALEEIRAGERDVEVERRSVALAAKTGNGEAALGSARRLARLEPTRVNLLALGNAEMAAGQPDAAVQPFEEALALGTEDDPGLREMLANTLIAAGRPALAADQFDVLATTANGARDEYRLRLAAGFTALKAGDRVRALARFRSAVKLESNREALGAAAEAARAAGQLAEAAAYLERLARFEPTRANLRALGEAQLAVGKPDLAVESFDKALALEAEDDPALRKMLANTLAAAGQPARAVDEFDGLAAKASVPADEYRLRLAAGFTALSAGDRARALAEFQRAIEIEPSREALAAAAETAIETGRLAEAGGYFERLALDRNATSRARDLEHLSIVYEKMGNVREAAKALARLPKAEQSQPAIIQRRAVLAQKLGGRGARPAHNAQPPTEPALSLGYAHQAAGQPDLAIVYFRRALAESRSLTAEQHRHVDAALGYAYAQSGQHQQAAAYFEKALAAWPRQDVGAR